MERDDKSCREFNLRWLDHNLNDVLVHRVQENLRRRVFQKLNMSLSAHPKHSQ